MLKPGLHFLLLLLAAPLFAQLHTPQYFSQYTQGTGWTLYYTDILIGDINMDTIPDVVWSKAEGYQIGYGKLADGTISFDMQPVDFYKLGWWYYKGQLVDYDRDGDLDWITAASNNFDYSLTFIMENEGGQLSGVFKPATPQFPEKAILQFGKFNNDDVDDLVYRITMPTSIHMLDGATGEPRALPFSQKYAEGRDINYDGLIDFYNINNFSPVYQTSTDNVYLNNGDYTFDHYETTGIPAQPVGLESPPYGDFDGDGIDDIFGRVTGTQGLAFVFKTNLKSQNEARLDTLIITSTQYTNAWFVMDVTDDGTDDLVVFTQDSLYFLETDDQMQFNVHAYGGILHAGLIRQHPELPKGTLIAMTYAGLPLLMNVSYAPDSGLMIKQDYNAFSPYVICESTYASPLTHTDVDADGQSELCVVAQFTLAFAELQPDETIAENYIQSGFDDFIGRSVSSGDWNGDGHDDLFLNEANRIYVSLRQPDSTWAERSFLTDGLLMEARDFDRNGFTDFLIGIIDSTFILFNDQGLFTGQEILPYTTPYPEYNIFDPNADGYPDIALSGDSTTIFMNRGDGTFYKGDAWIPGKLARNTMEQSPYVFTILNQDLEDVFFYRPNLFRVSPDGHNATWVAGHVLVNTVINARESWLVNYDGDSIPDLLYNMQWVDSLEWQAVLINEQEVAYSVLSVPNSFILGAEDVSEDGAAEVLYVKGSIAYLEIGVPTDVTSIESPVLPGPDLKIYPSPLSIGDEWTLSFESDYLGELSVDVFVPDGKLLRHFAVEKTQHQFISTFDGLQGTSGTYLVRVSEGNGTVIKKVIVID